MELRWSHVGLNCRNPAVTEDFYRTWFGFERARAVPIGDDDQIVFLRRDGVYLELFTSTARALEGVENDGPQQPGVARHLAFQTDDLEAFLDRVGDEIPRSLGPLSFDDVIPGWRTVWFTDPDGVVVEVSEGYHDEPADA